MTSPEMSTRVDILAPLSPGEQARRAELEEIVVISEVLALKAARAVRELRDRRLYRSTTLAEAATVTPTNDNVVTLPGPILLQAGAAILVRDTSATVGTGVTGVKLITATGDKPLTPATAEGDMTKWTFPGPDVQVWGLRVAGNPAKIGRIIARLTSTANLAAYAYALLRYRVPVVRAWTGLIRTLKRVPCRGVALFEVAGGDVALDVQRCTYDLTAGSVKVEAGTPLASSDAAALVGKIDSLERVNRKLGGG